MHLSHDIYIYIYIFMKNWHNQGLIFIIRLNNSFVAFQKSQSAFVATKITAFKLILLNFQTWIGIPREQHVHNGFVPSI